MKDIKEGDKKDKIITNLIRSNYEKSYIKDNYIVNHID